MLALFSWFGFSSSLVSHGSAPSNSHRSSHTRRAGCNAARPSNPLNRESTTLRVATGVADDAALLACKAASTVRAGPDDGEFSGFGRTVLDKVVLAHRPGHAVGYGEDGARADAGGMAVLDAAKLVHDLGWSGPVGHGERDHTAQGVGERRRRTPGLAQDYETLARTELVVVHRNVHRAMAGLQLLRHPGERAWPAVARLGQRDMLDDLRFRDERRAHRLLGLTRAQNLGVARSITVDRYALTVQAVGQPVSILDVLRRRLVGEVDRLRYTHRGVLLERRLHPDVPLGRDVMRGHPHAPDVLRDLRDVADVAVLGDLLHQLLGVETPLFGYSHELGIHIRQFHVRLSAHKRHREEWFDPARAARDNRDSPRRRYGRNGRVAHAVAASLVAGAFVVRHDAPFLRQRAARLPRLVVYELHDLF